LLIAQERGFAAMRLAGSVDFKRHAWIAAEARGIEAIGHDSKSKDHLPAL
jgi:hypothetical protein